MGSYFNPQLFEFDGRTVMLQTQLPWLIPISSGALPS
jgi:hypothetical protein